MVVPPPELIMPSAAKAVVGKDIGIIVVSKSSVNTSVVIVFLMCISGVFLCKQNILSCVKVPVVNIIAMNGRKTGMNGKKDERHANHHTKI